MKKVISIATNTFVTGTKALLFMSAFLFVVGFASPLFAQEQDVTSSNLANEQSVIEEAQPIDQDFTLDQGELLVIDDTITTEPELTKDQEKALKGLEKQLEKGDITQEEYDMLKTEILGQTNELSAEALTARVAEVDPEAQTLGKYLAPQVSTVNGSLSYEYPIVLPPGINGLTPDLSLIYNSNNKSQSSVVGTGWAFNIPYIQRFNKTGTNNLYTDNYFTSSLDGELVDQGNGIYTPWVENGTFLKYEYINDTWKVTDKTGTVYEFGTTEQARQDDPNDSTKIFSWMLETVTDTNGNTINYIYFKDQGQIYPNGISYGASNVTFNRTIRSVTSVSYESTFAIRTAYLINQIQVESDSAVNSSYDITNQNNLVTNITLTGYEGVQSFEMPNIELDYEVSSQKSFTLDPTKTFDYQVLNATRSGDLNGDGLLDFITAYYDSSTSNAYWYVHLNNGNGFTTTLNRKRSSGTETNPTQNFTWPDSGMVFYYNKPSAQKSYDINLADVNADGLVDVIDISDGGNAEVYLNNYSSPNLSKITTPQGGETNLTYTHARIQDDSNQVPFPVEVVESITTDDQQGNIVTTSYEYAGASYYYDNPFNHKFAGFASVAKTNPDGTVETTKYHQANGQQGNEPTDSYSRIGKIYEQTTEDGSNNLYSRIRTNYTENNLGGIANSVQLESQLTQQYDGTSSHTDIAVGYNYDSYGNVLTETQYGEVNGSSDGSFSDIGTDKRTIDRTYTTDTTAYIVGLPTNQTIKNNSSTKEAETNYSYDSNGNLLTESHWIDGSNYADTGYTYDSFGNVLTETDPLNHTTSYSYDSYHLYPTTVTNAKSQSTSYTYDYSSGKPTGVTEPNGKVTQYNYDGLDRLTEVKGTLGNGGTETTRTRSYNTTANPQYIKDTTYRSGSESQDSYSYLDGFGKTIQTKTEMDGGWITLDTVYDNMSRVKKQSLPYQTSSSSHNNPTTTSALLTSFTYDALGRVLSNTNAKGTTETDHDGFTTTITDVLNNSKDLITDAFGNLTEVNEHNDGATYTTQYQYNTQNLLTKITDAENNVRNLTYDGLGRRTSLEDLHGSSDGTFGTWNFTYNDINLTSQTDPNATTTSYTYDELNRILSEDNSGTTGTDITYTYDSCTNGTGMLCMATTPDTTTNYTYLKQGLVDTETVTIDGTGYTTDYDYNRQGDITKEIHPNASYTEYGHNTQGLVDEVKYNGTQLVTASYGVHGRPTSYTHANGITSTFTYDPSELYELTNKTTTNGTTDFQNLSYSYDNVGNITQIVDASNTDTAKTQTFTYDDLYRLTGTTVTNAANAQGYTRSYSYSPIGNITSFDGVPHTYTDTGYSNPHAVTSVGTTNYTYDSNGNLTTDGTWTHTWNYNNTLARSTDGTSTSSYEYDHTGQRTKLVEGSDTTLYPNSDYEVTNGTAKVYMNLGDTLVATDDNGTINHIHTDHLGGTNITTDSTGAITQTLDYYPYGATRIDTGTNDETKQFTGYIKDSSTVLNYAGARYLNGQLGKFISQDPASLRLGTNEKKEFEKMLTNPQLLNTYSYAGNNPVMNVDNNGELSKEVFKQHPLSSIVHVVGWKSFALGFRTFNKPLAATLLSHSASLEPGNITIDASNQSQYGNAIDKIVNTKPYQDYIQGQIDNFNNGKALAPGSFNFETSDNPDLYYALHGVNIKADISKDEVGLNINATITDKYDFKNPDGGSEKALAIQTPVRQAYRDGNSGYLSKFNTTIKINQRKKYENNNN